MKLNTKREEKQEEIERGRPLEVMQREIYEREEIYTSGRKS